MKVSVVVPAYNEAQWIGKLLRSLVRQTRPPMEIIVVDNGSTDGTAEVVRSFRQVKLITEPVRGVARARNRGVSMARGEIIASTDADCVVMEDWIEKIESYFENNQSVAVAGTIVYADGPWLIRWLTESGYFMWYFAVTQWLFGFQSLSTANSAWLKIAFDQVGGFDERISDPNGLDDMELASRLSREGEIGRDRLIKITASYRRHQNLGKATSTFWMRNKRMLEIGLKYRYAGNR